MQKIKSKGREWLEIIIFSLAVVLPVRAFVVEAFQIPTGSMEKTLLIGDFLFVNKMIYGAKIPFTDYRLPGYRNVQLGDIIVFVYPKDNSLNYVKRCVGMPGSTLEIREKKVYVDRVEYPLPSTGLFIDGVIPQSERDERIFPKHSNYNRDFYGPITIPKKSDIIELNASNYYLYKDVLEYEGYKPSIMGNTVYLNGVQAERVVLSQNYYFGLGDSRDNSEDSRYWGFIPELNMIGSPLLLYWSWDPNISIFNFFEKFASIRWNRVGKPLW